MALFALLDKDAKKHKKFHFWPLPRRFSSLFFWKDFSWGYRVFYTYFGGFWRISWSSAISTRRENHSAPSVTRPPKPLSKLSPKGVRWLHGIGDWALRRVSFGSTVPHPFRTQFWEGFWTGSQPRAPRSRRAERPRTSDSRPAGKRPLSARPGGLATAWLIWSWDHYGWQSGWEWAEAAQTTSSEVDLSSFCSDSARLGWTWAGAAQGGGRPPRQRSKVHCLKSALLAFASEVRRPPHKKSADLRGKGQKCFIIFIIKEHFLTFTSEISSSTIFVGDKNSQNPTHRPIESIIDLWSVSIGNDKRPLSYDL